jgi:hypothetical protein
MTKIINEPCASTLILNCKLERKKEKDTKELHITSLSQKIKWQFQQCSSFEDHIKLLTLAVLAYKAI